MDSSSGKLESEIATENSGGAEYPANPIGAPKLSFGDG